MIWMLNRKLSIQRILEYLLVMAVILNCNSVYAAADTDFHLNEINAILMAVLIIVELSGGKISKALLFKWTSVFLPYYMLMFGFAVVSVPRESLFGFASRFIIFIPLMALYLSCLARKGVHNRILSIFVDIIVFISTVSIFFWFFGSLLQIIHPNMIVHAYWGREYDYPGYFGLYFERQTISLFSYSGYRNDGIFTEGPMFSLCIIMALAMLLFIKEFSSDGKLTQKSKLKMLILIVALFTVMSLSGFAMMGALVFFKFIIMIQRNRKSYAFKMIVSSFILIIGGFLFVYLLMEKQKTSSWLIRFDDIQAGIKAWRAAPIFGNGYGTYEVKQYMSSFRWWNTGYSNALFSVLSQGGIVLFSAYLLAFFYGLKGAYKSKEKTLAIFTIVIFAEFVVTLVHYTFLMLFLLAYCYSIYLSSDIYKQKKVLAFYET